MTHPKPPRPVGRLAQCNKVLRLQRRRLGQWQPQQQVVREEAVTRFSLEDAEWRKE